MPDFYAKQVIGSHPSCLNVLVDHKLKPYYDMLGVCYTMKSLGYTYDENGDPLITDCQSKDFVAYYPSADSVVAFQALYDNTDGLQDKFVNYWTYTANALASNPYVVGFDPLNEPFMGNFLRHYKYLKPGNQDRLALAPMFTRIYNESYKPADPESVMWFEPNQVPDTVAIGRGYVFPVGYEVPPGGEIGSPYHVLNDHTYCCAAGAKVCSGGEPTPEAAPFCQSYHDRKLEKRNADAERLGVPLFISEFGACLTEDSCRPEINSAADAADRYLAGWCYWQFKNYADLTTTAGTGSEGFYNEDGTLQAWKVKALARTYMPYTQGTLTSQSFDTTTGLFNASFVFNATVNAPSVIYTSSEYWYTNMRVCTVSHNGTELTAKDYHWD